MGVEEVNVPLVYIALEADNVGVEGVDVHVVENLWNYVIGGVEKLVELLCG